MSCKSLFKGVFKSANVQNHKVAEVDIGKQFLLTCRLKTGFAWK